MNNLAFQIYGSTKSGIFQSTWDTTLVSALGSETAAISASGTNWALNTGATNLNVGGYKHTAGSTTNLTTTLAAVIMQMYQITYTISGRTAGSVTINYGGVSTSGLTTSSLVNILATATTVFSITPTSDFDGVISISVKQTSSATNQIKLPLPNTGTYNIWVDWGDGTYNNITSYNSVNTLHTYPTSGIYTVRITGNVFNWTFSYGATNDRLKIKSISSWGKLKMGTSSFNSCSNLTLSGITDVPDLSTVTGFQNTFSACTSITTIGRLNEWNTTTITNMGAMFAGASNFNQSIGNWNVSNVTSFADTFNGSGFNDSSINNWTLNTTSNIDMTRMFALNTVFNKNLNLWNVSKVTNFHQMFTFATSFNNGYASGVSNQLPWTINTTAASVLMTNMFQNATAFNSNLGTGTTPWDVSKVTTFGAMFNGATKFTNGDDSAPINNWNINTVSNVVMNSMFQSASSFNQNIGSWNVSSVTNMAYMFYNATAFNKSLSNWERLSSPDTSTLANVTDMTAMFSSATAFNKNIGNWNVSNVSAFATGDVSGMFYNATNFNNEGSGDIGNWQLKTTGTISMQNMFRGTAFNQNINAWNTVAVNNMRSMFYNATAFDQPLSNWKVGSVTTMNSMFFGAIAFNQDISTWERIDSSLSLVSDMNGMFQGATAFKQYIGNWNVSNVNNFGGFMALKTPTTFPSTYLDAIYNGWIVNGVKPNINISFGTAKYTAAGTAGRLTLTSAPNNWIITDGGL